MARNVSKATQKKLEAASTGERTATDVERKKDNDREKQYSMRTPDPAPGKRRTQQTTQVASKQTKSKVDQHKFSKKQRTQVAEALADTHIATWDKLVVGQRLADMFDLNGDDRQEFLDQVNNPHVLQDAGFGEEVQNA